MILLDYSQIALSNIIVQKLNDENMIRHMVLNSIRMYNKRYRKEYGQMVLCSDAGDPWRRDFFPQYKHSRKMARQDGPFDWANIFKIITEIKNEVKENFPYKMMYVENSEADDLIATIIKMQEEDKYLVVSGDKDFIQLHHYGNVYQYSPLLKGFIGEQEDPVKFLREQIEKGNLDDGVES